MRRAVFNQKGGVGKTSITCNLAAAMAARGRKTLVVDLDAQANATQYLLGPGATAVTRTITEFFESTLSFKLFKETLRECIYPTPHSNLLVIPADAGLLDLQPKLEGRYKIFKLREALTALAADAGFDEILIDTPPALNFYSTSALIASDRVLIPFDCDAFSADALSRVSDIVREVAADHQPDLAVEGIVINQFQAGARQPREAIAALTAAGYRVLTPYLPSSVIMRESHAARLPLAQFRPSHKLAEAFDALAQSLVAGTAVPKAGTTGARRPAGTRRSDRSLDR